MNDHKIVVIERCATETWAGPPPVLAAVASDEEAAKRWIQDEVDGKHNSGHSYASGHSAEWWIEYGTFRLSDMEIQT
jgi:hypothetical protein